MNYWPQRLSHAHDNNEPYPNLSTDAPDATTQDAYAIQQDFVKLLPGTIVGYKAALTGAPAQAAMGIDEPVSGVLFDWGAYQADTNISTPRQLLLETEFGYRVAQDRDITQPVTPENVLDYIASCHPMIELASPNLASRTRGIDLVAANSASFGYIEGQGINCSGADLDLDQINVSLARDGETLHEASSGSVMDSQRNAIAWLINQILHLGGEVNAGMLLMSGAIGSPHPGKPGNYRAEFGALGQIEFAIGPHH